MPTTTTGKVPLSDLAAHLGAPIELAGALAERVGKVELDWAGAPVVSETVAAKVLAEHKAEAQAHYQRTVEFQDAHRRWEAEREQVRRDAYRAELDKIVKRETAEIERLAVEGSAAWGDETGRGWAPGGFPARYDRPSPAAYAKAIEAGRKARDRYDAKHPEPMPS